MDALLLAWTSAHLSVPFTRHNLIPIILIPCCGKGQWVKVCLLQRLKVPMPMGALVLGLVMESKRGMQRLLLWVFLALLIITMLFTLSRGSYISIPFCLLTLIFLYKTIRIKIIIYAVFLSIGLLVVVPSSVKKRVEYTVDQRYTQQDQITVMGITLDTSTTARIRSWQKVLRDIGESPFWGLGVTGYSFLDAQYRRTLIETGFIGLALLGKLIFSIFSLAFRLKKLATDWFYQGLANGMIIGLVALTGILLPGLMFWLLRK